MARENSNTIKLIRETVNRIVPESRILLFGSRVRGEYSSQSDYDFLIVTSNAMDTRKRRNLKSLIRKELARFKIPVDILMQSEDEVKMNQEIPGHIVKQVIKEGVAI